MTICGASLLKLVEKPFRDEKQANSPLLSYFAFFNLARGDEARRPEGEG